MNTLEVLHYSALAAGYALALARLTDTARPLWNFLPVKLQPVMPALLVVLPDLAAGLQHSMSAQDVANSVLASAGAFMISMRGALPAEHFEQLTEGAKKEIAVVRGTASEEVKAEVKAASIAPPMFPPGDPK